MGYILLRGDKMIGVMKYDKINKILKEDNLTELARKLK